MSELIGAEVRLIWVPNVRNSQAPTAEEIAAGTELLTPADIKLRMTPSQDSALQVED